MNKRFKQIIKCYMMQKNHDTLGFIRLEGQYTGIELIPRGEEERYKLIYGDAIEIWGYDGSTEEEDLQMLKREW